LEKDYGIPRDNSNKYFKILTILEHKMEDGLLDGKDIMEMIIGKIN
jgi:hypothetical protein